MIALMGVPLIVLTMMTQRQLVNYKLAEIEVKTAATYTSPLDSSDSHEQAPVYNHQPKTHTTQPVDFVFYGASIRKPVDRGTLPNAIWFGTHRRPMLMDVVDGVCFGLITGLIFAAFWP